MSQLLASRLIAERPDRMAVAWRCVVREMSSHHARQPAALLGDGLLPASLELVPDLGKLGPHPLRDGDTLEQETSVPGLPADVREAQEIERLGLPGATLRSPLGRVASELDEPRLVGMQLQAELREPLAKLSEEPLRVSFVLEPGHESSAKRVMTTSPRAFRRLHDRAHRSKT